MALDPGWYVNECLLPDLFVGNPVPTDKKKLEKKLCDLDIRDYALPCLSNCCTKETLTGPVVLQLTRFRNVSQPKIKEDQRSDEDVIRLSLSDGHTSISGILLEAVKGLNADTPPGTKLLISGKVPLEGGFLLLRAPDIAILGGRVEKLIEKWTIERHSLGDGQRASRSDNKAPKWISFGKRINKTADVATIDFRANDAIRSTNKKECEEQSSFDLLRKENIDSIHEGPVKAFIAPKIQVPVRTAREPNEAKKPKPLVLTDKGHDRRVKRRKGKGKDDSDDEGHSLFLVPAEFARPSKPSTLFDFVATNVSQEVVDNQRVRSGVSDQSSGNSFKQSQERVEVIRMNSRGVRDFRTVPGGSGKSNYENGRERQQKGDKGNFGSQRGIRRNQRDSFQDDRRLAKPQGERKAPSNRQTSTQNEAVNSSRSNTSGTPERVSMNQGQQAPQLMNGYRNRKLPQSLVQNIGYIPDGVMQALSNMRLNDSSRKPLFNMPYQPPPQRILRNPNPVTQWKIGDQCRAPWSDGTFYMATIVNVGPADMCAVRFNEYGNIITVPQAVLLRL